LLLITANSQAAYLCKYGTKEIKLEKSTVQIQGGVSYTFNIEGEYAELYDGKYRIHYQMICEDDSVTILKESKQITITTK
jgi:hypothetical protein